MGQGELDSGRGWDAGVDTVDGKVGEVGLRRDGVDGGELKGGCRNGLGGRGERKEMAEEVARGWDGVRSERRWGPMERWARGGDGSGQRVEQSGEPMQRGWGTASRGAN